MAIFKKKNTLIGNITYMALMAAINVIFVLLASWIPMLLLLLVFILPLASTIVAYFCEKKYFIIYAIATVILCTISSFWDLGNVIFYVVPSIISGLVFGLLLEKRVPPIFIILSAVLTQLLLSYLAIPLIQLIYQRNIVTDFATLFGLENYTYLNYVEHMFVCALAMIQQTLSFMIINEELSRFDVNPHFAKNDSLIIALATIFFILLSALFAWLFPEVSYVPLLFSLLLSIYLIGISISEKTRWVIIAIPIALFLSFFLFSIFYQPVKQITDEPLGLLLIQFFPLFIAIIVLINNYLLKKTKKATIENRK